MIFSISTEITGVIIKIDERFIMNSSLATQTQFPIQNAYFLIIRKCKINSQHYIYNYIRPGIYSSNIIRKFIYHILDILSCIFYYLFCNIT
jgi:hypothetical protein